LSGYIFLPDRDQSAQNNTREQFIAQADEVEILRQYIELQRDSFNSVFHYEIPVSPDILHPYIATSLLLQPLVENAINHDGIGRAKAKAINKNFRKERNSYGILH